MRIGFHVALLARNQTYQSNPDKITPLLEQFASHGWVGKGKSKKPFQKSGSLWRSRLHSISVTCPRRRWRDIGVAIV
eukprot:g2047.t1